MKDSRSSDKIIWDKTLIVMESERMGLLSKVVGTHSEREVKRVLPIGAIRLRNWNLIMRNCQMSS